MTKISQGFYPSEPPPGLRHGPIEELSALRDPHLHFTTFENSNLCSKTGISKTAWINTCYGIWGLPLKGLALSVLKKFLVCSKKVCKQSFMSHRTFSK